MTPSSSSEDGRDSASRSELGGTRRVSTAVKSRRGEINDPEAHPPTTRLAVLPTEV